MSEIKVGVGVLIVRNHGTVLLGQRKGAHGEDLYAGPGGHLEYGETLEQAARREIAEECGPDMVVGDLVPLCVTDLLCYPGRHYVDIGFAAVWKSGEPAVMEPDRVESWDWWPTDGLPLVSQLFRPVDKYVECWLKGWTAEIFSFPANQAERN